MPFGVLFLPYLLLVALSAYTTIGLLTSIDGEAVRHRLGGAVPTRAAGGLLIGLTGLFVAINLANIVAGLAGQTTDALDLVPVWTADFLVVIPTCLAAGILLWRHKALGYVAGAGVLLQYSLLFFGLVAVLAFPALYDGSLVAVGDIMSMLACGLLCAILLALFVRGAAPDRAS